MIARLASRFAMGVLLCGAADAAPPAAWFPVGADARYQTGDSWTEGHVTYRLYGVQSCLRGTLVTNGYGLRRDCGEASLAMLASLVRDLRPRCYAAAPAREGDTVLVLCFASPRVGAGRGARLDLGTALIATGYAFAARAPDGTPVHPPYAAAEDVARHARAGLWAFPDLPEPAAIIRRALAAGAGAAPLESRPAR